MPPSACSTVKLFPNETVADVCDNASVPASVALPRDKERTAELRVFETVR